MVHYIIVTNNKFYAPSNTIPCMTLLRRYRVKQAKTWRLGLDDSVVCIVASNNTPLPKCILYINMIALMESCFGKVPSRRTRFTQWSTCYLRQHQFYAVPRIGACWHSSPGQMLLNCLSSGYFSSFRSVKRLNPPRHFTDDRQQVLYDDLDSLDL